MTFLTYITEELFKPVCSIPVEFVQPGLLFLLLAGPELVRMVKRGGEDTETGLPAPRPHPHVLQLHQQGLDLAQL